VSPVDEVACTGDHCITCSDEGVQLGVLTADADGLALCEGDVEVMTALVGPVSPGDQVLVHAGVAIARVA
jgi:hydrogenase maturation factor